MHKKDTRPLGAQVDGVERLRVELDRRRMLRASRTLLDTQVAERKLEREAVAAMLRDRRVTVANATERQAIQDLLAAQRRDALRQTLTYPMTDAELALACEHAAIAAKVPCDDLPDVVQALALEVVRRHGSEPQR